MGTMLDMGVDMDSKQAEIISKEDRDAYEAAGKAAKEFRRRWMGGRGLASVDRVKLGGFEAAKAAAKAAKEAKLR